MSENDKPEKPEKPEEPSELEEEENESGQVSEYEEVKAAGAGGKEEKSNKSQKVKMVKNGEVETTEIPKEAPKEAPKEVLKEVPKTSPKAAPKPKQKECKKCLVKVRSRSSRRKRRNGVTLDNIKIGFLGSGKMTEAIVRGLLREKFEAKQMFIASKNGKTHEIFKSLGATVMKRTIDIFDTHKCHITFLAFHGYAVKQCYQKGIRPLALCTNYISDRPKVFYVLSLVGGVSLKSLKEVLLNPDIRRYRMHFYRLMLNAAVAYSGGLGAINVDIDSKKMPVVVRDVLTKIAKMEYCSELNMDIFCAVGGNGLAIAYYYITALANCGLKLGMSGKMALQLARVTAKSASNCLVESGKSTNVLMEGCLSPSGPAVYGIDYLKKKECAAGIASAVEAAYNRLKHLANNPLD